MNADLIAGLPGASLIAEGLADLAAGRPTIAAYLVQIARTRLVRAGLVREEAGAIEWSDEPERELYRCLRREGGDAYSRYNALLRELASFESALDRRLRLTSQGIERR